MIRILLADDHPLILRGVEELLSAQPDMEVVGKESRASRIVEAVSRLSPDILVQDLTMQGEMAGIEVIRQVTAAFPKTKVIVLSMHSSNASAWEALEQGAHAYVTKLGDFDELIEAIRAVLRGEQFIGQPLSEAEIDDYGRYVRIEGAPTLSALTKRELEVLSLVAVGRTSSEIADELRIGRRTVESHRANLSSKLGLRNQAEIVRYAIERGLVN
jgi:DNA-binding NarL/FixJ family response regulator